MPDTNEALGDASLLEAQKAANGTYGSGQGAPTVAPWNGTRRLDAVYGEIVRLGLQEHVAELDNLGYTIVPPEKVGPPDLGKRLLEALSEIAERQDGVKPDFGTGLSHSTIPQERRDANSSMFPYQEEYGSLLYRGRIFEELALNPTILALTTYLLGEHAQLSTMSGWLRGPSEAPENFIPKSVHCDNVGIPSPFPPYSQLCNATMALTDYTTEGGCLGFIPGSNQLRRHPLSSEEGLDRWHPAECRAGSLIFWGGETWHTIGNPRRIPGLRASIITMYVRAYMMPINQFCEWITPEMLDRNPERFATLVGIHNRLGVNKDPKEVYRVPSQLDERCIAQAPSRWE
jgi:ectoine hydroxylase-related dioxygenase (phytanoyl-CoA dioxygenase family)